MPLQNAKTKKSLQPKCPNCGANVRFSAKHGMLYCEHCQGIVGINRDKNVRERDFSELSNYTKWSDSDVACYACKNCGAHSILPKTTVATSCSYCGSPVVVDKDSMGSVKPDTIIPFELSYEQARDAISAWRKTRFFAPTAYKKQLNVDSIKGVYLPVWTFDSSTTTFYHGRLGKRCTRTVHVKGKTYTQTYIKWFVVSGTKTKVFDDILVRGNMNLSEKYFDSMKPFPQSKYLVYSDEFLAGYMADNYTIEPKEAFSQAEAKMKAIVQQEILRAYNADVVGDLHLDMRFDEKSFKFLYVPTYITATRYKDKTFNNYVSGISTTNKQQPKVSGTSPTSPVKVLLTVLFILALLVAIALIANSNQNWLGGIDTDWDFDFWGKTQSVATWTPTLQQATHPLRHCEETTFPYVDVAIHLQSPLEIQKVASITFPNQKRIFPLHSTKTLG